MVGIKGVAAQILLGWPMNIDDEDGVWWKRGKAYG